MSLQTWHETISPPVTADGPTLTAAAAASCIPTMSKFTLPNNFFSIAGRKLKIILQGRISVAVTTPGTGRFDIRLGGTVIFDTGAFNLNVVAKTNVPWWLEIDLRGRAVGAGTATNFIGFGQFMSEAYVGSPVPSAGGNGGVILPVGAPTVGAGVDGTAAMTFDAFFTQTVATGSLTVHDFEVVSRV